MQILSRQVSLRYRKQSIHACRVTYTKKSQTSPLCCYPVASCLEIHEHGANGWENSHRKLGGFTSSNSIRLTARKYSETNLSSEVKAVLSSNASC